MSDKRNDLFQNRPVAINIGISDFAESLKIQGVEVIHLSWNPPADGDPELLDLLDRLL